MCCLFMSQISAGLKSELYKVFKSILNQGWPRFVQKLAYKVFHSQISFKNGVSIRSQLLI